MRKIFLILFVFASAGVLANCERSKIHLTSPPSGAVFDGCEEITFSGYALQTGSGFVPGSALHWASDLDGDLDNGSRFTLRSLSSGTHVITLTASGKDGTTLTDSVEITIKAQGAAQLFSGVAVDPYIVGATFYEDRNNNGEQDAAEQESSATNDDGRFNFGNPVSPCSTIRMKDKGLHLGLPFAGELKARAAQASFFSDNQSLQVVSPLTTLLANGWTKDQIIQVLRLAGIPGITRDKLDRDPMDGMGSLNVRRLTDGSLALVRGTLTIAAALQIIDGMIKLQGTLPGRPASGYDITYAQLRELDDFFAIFLKIGRLLTKIMSYEQIRQAVKNIGEGTRDCVNEGLGMPPLVTADIFIKAAAVTGNYLIEKLSKDLTDLPSDYQIGGWALDLANNFFVIKYKDDPCVLHLIETGLLPDATGFTNCRINSGGQVECF